MLNWKINNYQVITCIYAYYIQDTIGIIGNERLGEIEGGEESVIYMNLIWKEIRGKGKGKREVVTLSGLDTFKMEALEGKFLPP